MRPGDGKMSGFLEWQTSCLCSFSAPPTWVVEPDRETAVWFAKDSFASPGVRAADLQKLGDNGTVRVSVVTSTDALQWERPLECPADR